MFHVFLNGLSPDDRILFISHLQTLKILAERCPPDRASYLSEIETIRCSLASSGQQAITFTEFAGLLTAVSDAGIQEMIFMTQSRPTTVVVQRDDGHRSQGMSTLTAASGTSTLTTAITTPSTTATATTAASSTIVTTASGTSED